MFADAGRRTQLARAAPAAAAAHSLGMSHGLLGDTQAEDGQVTVTVNGPSLYYCNRPAAAAACPGQPGNFK